MSRKKTVTVDSGKPDSQAPPPALASAAWRDRMDDIDHVLDSARMRRGLLPARLNAPEQVRPATAAGSTPISPKQTMTRRDEKAVAPRGGFLASCILLIGLMAFACGGVLLGWYAVER